MSARLTRNTPAGIVVLAFVLGTSACIDNVKPADPLAEEQSPTIGEFIEVVPDVAELPEVGDRIQLNAAVRDARGRLIPGARVTWQAADPGIATVDESGNVTGTGEGLTEIRGINGNISSVAVIAVAKPGNRTGGNSNTTVALSPDSTTVPTVGGTVKLLAVGRNPGGKLISGDKMDWGSTDPSVATVSGGEVTGQKSGSAKIIVVNGGAADTADVSVAPPNVPAAVVVTPDADTIPTVGGSVILVGRVLNGTGDALQYAVGWASLDPSIAIVSGSGTVTGLAKGVARIRASYGALSDTARIWVAQTVTATSVFVTPKVDTIAQVGGTTQLTATALDGGAKPITGAVFSWSSVDPSVATVDGTGTVKGISSGTARVIARLGTLVDTASVVVAPVTQAVAITILPQVDTIRTLGTWSALAATATDSQGKPVTVTLDWISLDPTVAYVGDHGDVKGVGKGMTHIVAKHNSLADTATVFVAPDTTGGTTGSPSVRIVPDSAAISAIGGTFVFGATLKDAQGNTPNAEPTWATLDPTLASVNADGGVTALAQGTARITATWNGVSDTARITIGSGTTTSASLSVSHSPSNPTTTSTVTITSTVSGSTSYTSSSIQVDGQVLKTCSSSSCSYSAVFPSGSHTYSAQASNGAGNSLSAGPKTFTVWQTTSGGGTNHGSATSPHWSHMRTSTIDYRIHYQSGAQQVAEYDWAASHFDRVTGGTLTEYKRRNPSILHFPYDTYWFVPVDNASTVTNWLSTHGYNVENAFLHQAGTSKSTANRITAQQFLGRDYWYYNVGDPGFKAWRQARTNSLMSGGSDGIFFDTNSRNAANKYVPATTLEYSSYTSYFADFDALLASHRAWVPAGYVLLNQSTYFNKSEEMNLAEIAGGTMTEFVNGPYRDPKWNEVDALVADGVVVEYGTAIKANHKSDLRYNVNSGNYNSVTERVLMWEYASYLMVVNPAFMDGLYFEPYIGSWDAPMDVVWLNAFEYDIGLATASRALLTSGTDGAGQSYQVYQRPFQNGLVLIRPQGGKASSGTYDYGDASRVTVQLPGGTWRLLLADGTQTAPLSSVNLRAGEAVVLTY